MQVKWKVNVNIKFYGEKYGEKKISLDVQLMKKKGATPDSFSYLRFVYFFEGAIIKFGFVFLIALSK